MPAPVHWMRVLVVDTHALHLQRAVAAATDLLDPTQFLEENAPAAALAGALMYARSVRCTMRSYTAVSQRQIRPQSHQRKLAPA